MRKKLSIKKLVISLNHYEQWHLDRDWEYVCWLVNPDIFSFSFPPIFISLFIWTLKSSKVLFTINHKTATAITRSDQLASSSLRGEAIAADAALLKCNRQSITAGIKLLQKCRSQFSMEMKSCKLSCEQIYVLRWPSSANKAEICSLCSRVLPPLFFYDKTLLQRSVITCMYYFNL